MPALILPITLHQLQCSLDCSRCHFRTLTQQKTLHGFVLCKCTVPQVSPQQARRRLMWPAPCRTAAASNAGVQHPLLWHCNLASTLGMNTLYGCSAFRAFLLSGCNEKKKGGGRGGRRQETTSDHSLEDDERCITGIDALLFPSPAPPMFFIFVFSDLFQFSYSAQ